ncbi:MAG: tetratricopeptide repeat protein [Myxococcota bacterium]
MMRLRQLPLLTLAVALVWAPIDAKGAGSEPKRSPPKSKSKPPSKEARAIGIYNEGVALMRAKKFARAQKKFEKALKLKNLAEAHNNLGYCLRKQGSTNFERALQQYEQAVRLGPDLPEPRMYRGVLYVQMGRMTKAKEEHAALLQMDPRLAAELQHVITHGEEKAPEQFFGVSGPLDVPRAREARSSL